MRKIFNKLLLAHLILFIAIGIVIIFLGVYNKITPLLIFCGIEIMLGISIITFVIIRTMSSQFDTSLPNNECTCKGKHQW